jgi:hypothetical protein
LASIVVRRLLEVPVPGGERFSAAIGPSRTCVRLTQAALLLALGAVLCAALGPVGPIGESGCWLGAGGFLALSILCGCLSGGGEFLDCERLRLTYRRIGMLGERRQVVLVTRLRRLHPPAGRGLRAGWRGVRVDTEQGVWCFGKRLRGEDATRLAELLQRHLNLTLASVGDLLGSGSSSPRLREGPAESPVASSPAWALKQRGAPRAR